jgi:hypothetical protein
VLAWIRKAFVNLGAEHSAVVSFVARVALAFKHRWSSVDAEGVIRIAVVCGRTPVFVRATVVERQAEAKDLAGFFARVDDNGTVVSSPAMDTVARIVTNGIRASGAILTRVACTLVNVSRAIFPFPAYRTVAEIITNYVEARGTVVEDLLINLFICPFHSRGTAQLQIRRAVSPREKSLRHLC